MTHPIGPEDEPAWEYHKPVVVERLQPYDNKKLLSSFGVNNGGMKRLTDLLVIVLLLCVVAVGGGLFVVGTSDTDGAFTVLVVTALIGFYASMGLLILYLRPKYVLMIIVVLSFMTMVLGTVWAPVLGTN